MLNGKDYVAIVELSNKAGDIKTLPGDTCERVDPKSLDWLLDQGLIAPKPKRGAKKEE